MPKKNRSNLLSHNQITSPCQLPTLDNWYVKEALAIKERVVRDLVMRVHKHEDSFVQWPKKAMLVWPGCDRTRKYHQYPQWLQLIGLARQIPLDGRVNGPAVAAFCIAGGCRPQRFGSTNAWSVHHLYSGKFPYWGHQETLHAAKDGLHFTQTAGLVAVHPIADQMCDEYPFFSWVLRAKAYLTFGYDPDGVFSDAPHDLYGFVQGKSAIVLPPKRTNGKPKED